MYKIKNEDIKYFTIKCGLLPGYNKNNIEYTFSEAQEICKNWIEKRLDENKVVFGFEIIPTSFVYGFKNNEKIICNSEKSIQIQGEIIREYCENIFESNQEIEKIILDLAEELSVKLEQKRVHINFENQKIILEKND